MNKTFMAQLSENLVTLVADVSPRLVHIGGEGIPFRTGIRLDDGDIVTTAMSAEDGDKVHVRYSDGSTAEATVKAFDARSGLVLLSTGDKKEMIGWESESAYVGMLAVTVAFASPEGVESRLEMVRCVGENYFQTDGSSFPGFSGSAVLSSNGKLLGMVDSNAPGNRGHVLPYADLVKLVETLKTKGSTKRRVLGLRTQQVKEGLLVVEVIPDSASAAAGILVGDILESLNKNKLAGPLSLMEVLQDSSGEVEVEIIRGGKTVVIKATPFEKTETMSHQWKHNGCCGR